MDKDDWFLPLMEFNDFGGDWEIYLEAIYAVFKADFVTSPPVFRTRRLGLKRHPIVDGKESTFWHMISTGRVEEERVPDLRRCERIRWPKPTIENEWRPEVLVWTESNRSGDNRIHIYLPAERYLVVLADRGEYILPWTAFYVDHAHSHQKYIKRHQRNT